MSTDPMTPLTLHSRLVAIETRLAQLEARFAQLEQPIRPLPLTSMPEPFRPSSLPAQPERGWRPVNHKLPQGCGRIAFFLLRAVSPTEKAQLTLMRVGADLHQPALGEMATCRACGAEIDPFTTQDLDWSYTFTQNPDQTPTPSPFSETTPEDLTGRMSSIQDAMSRARSSGLIP